MWNLLWPVLLTVAADTFYHICAKSTPGDMNPLAGLTVSYLTAAAAACALFFLTSGSKDLAGELSHMNWSSPVLGVSIVGLELGFIYLYRAGWKVSVGSLVVNLSLACVLLFVGVLLYHETITPRQAAGLAVCVLGLFLLS